MFFFKFVYCFYLFTHKIHWRANNDERKKFQNNVEYKITSNIIIYRPFIINCILIFVLNNEIQYICCAFWWNVAGHWHPKAFVWIYSVEKQIFFCFLKFILRWDSISIYSIKTACDWMSTHTKATHFNQFFTINLSIVI